MTRHHHGFRGRRPRSRRRLENGIWNVRARVERFFEPALLLLLRERPMHGYELLERLPQVTAEDAVDVGNLYRALRALEEDGVVTSEWRGDLPGPAKRTYTLTAEGERLLDAWAAALGDVQGQVAEFLRRYDERR